MTRSLYEDAGEGDGPYVRRTVTCDGRTLSFGPREGDYVPGRVRVEVVGRGAIEVPEGAAEVTLP